MKTREERKIVRIFCLVTVWTLFVVCTLSGIIYAAEQTAYVDEGEEAVTVKLNQNLPQVNFDLIN